MNMSEEEEYLQNLVVESETLRAQNQAVQQQLIMVLNTLQELMTAKSALEELKKLAKGTDILVPLGGGAFVNAKLQETDNLLLNLGANVMANKSREDTIAAITSQVEQLDEAKDKLEEASGTIDMRLNQITIELQELVKKVRK